MKTNGIVMIKTFNNLKRDIVIWVMVAAAGIIISIMVNKDIFKTFTPRYQIFADNTLTFIEILTCSILSLGIFANGVIHLIIYTKNINKNIPSNEVRWITAISSFLVASIFAIESINIYYPMYWIDAIIRIVAMVLVFILIIINIVSFKAQINTPKREDIEKLRQEIEELKKANRDVNEI